MLDFDSLNRAPGDPCAHEQKEETLRLRHESQEMLVHQLPHTDVFNVEHVLDGGAIFATGAYCWRNWARW